MQRTFIALGGLVALVLGAGGPAVAGKPGSGGITNPAVVFTAPTSPGKPRQLFLVTANGSTVVQITNDGLNHRCPTWSPDGTRIAFFGSLPTQVDNHSLYSVRADGTDLRLHSVLWGTTGSENSTPNRMEWSPDGAKIAYVGANWEIYVLDLATSTPTLVLPTVDNSQQWSPTWSPDSTRLAFSRFNYAHGNHDLMVLDLPTGVVSNVTNDPANTDEMPSWSPDGEWLVFRRGASLHRIRPDGTDLAPIVFEGSLGSFYFPTWSSDGAWISFQATNARGEGDIYRVRADGTGLAGLTATRSRHEAHPAWNPAWTPSL
jgi:Tol biopolymer transport system component